MIRRRRTSSVSNEGIADRPDVVEAIREIESGSEPPLPSGEELASEIERFLRGQS